MRRTPRAGHAQRLGGGQSRLQAGGRHVHGTREHSLVDHPSRCAAPLRMPPDEFPLLRLSRPAITACLGRSRVKCTSAMHPLSLERSQGHRGMSGSRAMRTVRPGPALPVSRFAARGQFGSHHGNRRVACYLQQTQGMLPTPCDILSCLAAGIRCRVSSEASIWVCRAMICGRGSLQG